MLYVAAYCRVSTDKDDQIHSFSSQMRFFREYIERNSEWQLYEIYADSGITGTSTRKRFEFNRMMNDAYENRFNLILTKEVSRFSRNILDTIAYTRELRSLGIGVIFLSDGFSTLDPDAELRLSIMGSIAQEESRRISTRVKWGQTRQMEKGVVFGTSMLGFNIKNGVISINQEGAELVKKIFYKYGIEKKGTSVIARELREEGHKTFRGNAVWSESQIIKILKNEKYVGDLVQKKTYTPDFLTHLKQCNRGQEDMIILRDHHEGIISRDLWNTVQEEIKKRNRVRNSSGEHSSRYVFSGKIICGECGSRFVSRSKRGRDGATYRRWGCYQAARYGKLKSDTQGNILGCDIGKIIRDEILTDMLKYVICSLKMDDERIIKNIEKSVAEVVSSDMTEQNKKKSYEKRVLRLQEKKLAAVDSYLSGIITEEELRQIKCQYENDLNSIMKDMSKTNEGSERTTNNIRDEIKSMLRCDNPPDVFLKVLLDYVLIHKDGTIEIKLKELNSIWKFRIHYGAENRNAVC